MICKLCNQNLNNELNRKIISVKNPENKSETFNYIFCQNCGIGFLDNLEFVKTKENYDKDYNEYQNTPKQSFIEKALNFLYFPRDSFVKKFISNKNSILDLGCGNGSFLYSVSSVFKKVYGSEYNQYAVKIAKSKVRDMIVISEELHNIKEKFDVITMWHVLEHISNPMSYLNDVRNIMHKNSVLIIEVPNSSSFNFMIFKANYQWISLPEHLFFYNEMSLKYLLKAKELEIEDVFYPRMFPLLFSHHLKNPILRIFSIPISIFIYIIAPLFKATESIRIVVKKNEKKS